MTSRSRLGLRVHRGPSLLPVSQPDAPRTDADWASCSNGPLKLEGAPERACQWPGSATSRRAWPLGLRMPLTIKQGERQGHGSWRPLCRISAGSCRLGLPWWPHSNGRHTLSDEPAGRIRKMRGQSPLIHPATGSPLSSQRPWRTIGTRAGSRPAPIIGGALRGAGRPYYIGGRVPFG